MGIYKEGATEYTYIIGCYAGDDYYLPADSKDAPESFIIFDCTADEPYSDGLAKAIGFLVDNEDQSAIQSELQKLEKSFPNGKYPESLMLSLKKKGFYVTAGDSMKGAYLIVLDPDVYDYTKQDPRAILSIMYGNIVGENTIAQLTDKQAQFLMDYFSDHELEYFADFDTLVKQSGMNDRPELSK